MHNKRNLTTWQPSLLRLLHPLPGGHLTSLKYTDRTQNVEEYIKKHLCSNCTISATSKHGKKISYTSPFCRWNQGVELTDTLWKCLARYRWLNETNLDTRLLRVPVCSLPLPLEFCFLYLLRYNIKQVFKLMLDYGSWNQQAVYKPTNKHRHLQVKILCLPRLRCRLTSPYHLYKRRIFDTKAVLVKRQSAVSFFELPYKCWW